MSNSAILAFASSILAVALALIVAWHERRSLAHWAFVAGMVLFAAESIFAWLGGDALVPEDLVRLEVLKLVSMSCLPGIWLFFSLSYARGNYREFLVRWRFMLAAAFLVPLALAGWFHNELIVPVPPDGTLSQWEFHLGRPGVALNLMFLLGAVLVLMNLERTFRASVGTMRWRIKFMVLGLGVLFCVRAYTSSQVLLFRAVDPSLDGVNSAALLVACLLILRSLLREGHFDVHVYPSQSVLHNSLTFFLAGVYLLIVGVFAKVVTLLGGDSAFTLKAFLVLVALVLLTVLLLSDQVRLHTKRFVSRHFQRPLYDYRTVWRRFTEGMASRMDQRELCQSTVKLVADLFQVLSVTIWVVDEKKEKLAFAASTSLFEAQGGELSPPAADAMEVIRALENHHDPVEIDSSRENWAVILRRCHPDEFGKGGGRVCVPMIVAGEVLGLMILGDRVGGIPFSEQDFDLLKCVGDQVAAGLRNVQLSQKLLQAKELEAFQTMSAFFVHDLKNTASTLNLMLKNLPVHFDDPAFREDALRGVSKTVAHINHLISRLSLLRHGLDVRPAESDLNEVVSKALAGWKGAAEIDLIKELRPVPKVLLDQEQMLKVVTNLVLNATEAVAPKGQVRVQTVQNDGWAVLSVVDSGCGMSSEFMNRCLFRPFQTTKKNGFGIGMFQSKMIVEAHRGKIEVESELGKGATFRVFLPLLNK